MKKPSSKGNYVLAHATKSPSRERAESIAFGTKWAEDRFREDPNYAAFTLDMVSIDPAEVPNAKKREAVKNLICRAAVKRWRALRDQSSGHHHATRKTAPGQLKREIEAVLSKRSRQASTHATRKARAPRVVAYRLQLTPDAAPRRRVRSGALRVGRHALGACCREWCSCLHRK